MSFFQTLRDLLLPLLLLGGCSSPSVEDDDSGEAEIPSDLPPTGIVRSYQMTATYGDYELRMDGGMTMGVVHGYLLNGQFLGPTLVMDGGDSVDVTLSNQTDEPMGLHPHGVRYDMENEGVLQVAEPGGEITYHWEAVQGYGTFLYHSHEMDEELIEYQGEAGVLGVLVIRDPVEDALYSPDFMLNYVLMTTYGPWTEIDEDAMKHGDDDSASGDDDSSQEEFDATEHHHTMVVQEVSGQDSLTDTLESLTAFASLGDTVRVNLVGFGSEFHTFHIHGYTWNDLYTGQTLDTFILGPATSYHFYLPELDNPGLWMVHCHVDSHFHMMSTWLLVE